MTLLLLVSCGTSAATERGEKRPHAARSQTSVACGASGEITVAAAASLTDAFEAIGDSLEAACADATITFTFDSSTTLATQIRDGAPVDVFASADEASVERVADRAVGPSTVFARNRMVIVTKPGNPAGIRSLVDLRTAGVVALCAAEAPCGRFAAEVLVRSDVDLDEGQVTRSQNARATLTAVAEGDAVAGIVYASDAVAAADAVDMVSIPDDQNVVASYPVTLVDGPGHPQLARTFAEALLGAEAQRILAARGFLPPT